MKTISALLPHVSIILSGMVIVFVILDRFNPSMGYLTSAPSRVLLVVLALSAIANAILLIVRRGRE